MGRMKANRLAVAAFLASVLVAFVPVLVHRRSARVVSAVLLWVGCVVGMLSVGMFFVPAAILMTIAASHRPSIVASPMPPVPAG